jgi:hypothetical protein
MLLPLASFVDFLARSPEEIQGSEQGRIEALLDDASALVRAEAGRTWVVDGALVDVPDVVVTVTLAVARRAFTNPDMVESEALPGEYSVKRSDVYLTASEKSLVRRAGGQPGIWSLSVTRATSDMGDLPELCTSYVGGTGAPEELDPFAEGWPG